MKSYFVVTGIVMHLDEILVLKKHDKDRNYPGYWSFCSGFVKEFEAGEDTVIREIMEETGLKASIAEKGDIVKAVDNKNSKTWLVMPFLCLADSKEVILDHENQEYKWVTKEELLKLKFVPGLIADLKAVGLL